MAKPLYRILSPDGFDIYQNKLYLKSEINDAYQKWSDGFKHQGYYSLLRTKIPLDKLKDYCIINKTRAKRYKSKEILKLDDLYELQDSFCSSGITFQYRLTAGELKWARHINGKYLIADFVFENIDENNILTFWDPEELKQVIEDDGMPPKAVMLSDDTALQKLFFWLSNN